jgi:transposase InsO family protein
MAAAPNQRWVGDTTEFVIGESTKLYLAAVLDLYSRFIVGWACSPVNDRHLTIKALEMALKRRAPAAGLLHHSDQGCTYASEDYQAILDARGITCSMSRRGDCYDKAKAEVGVQVAQRWILARLRHDTFFSLPALNVRIREFLADLNARLMKGYGGLSRRDLFVRFDQPALRPLPPERFVYTEWSQARVNIETRQLGLSGRW